MCSCVFLQLDLSSLESVRKFVDEFHATGKKLHVIVNNPGLALNFKDAKRQYTADGFELTIGTNHLGLLLSIVWNLFCIDSVCVGILLPQ